MITLEHALSDYLSKIKPLGNEQVPIQEAVNRVLAEDVFADMDMPPFNKSAVDGYACRQEDLHGALTIAEVIPAGTFSNLKIVKGECAKIMTGAPVPNGADCVIMVEHTKNISDDSIQFLKSQTKSNICYTGEDVKSGDKILEAGVCLKAKHIPMLASVGLSEVSVYKWPKIGLLATGSELVEPSEMPGPGKIRNSNAYQLIALLDEMGISSTYYGIIADDEKNLASAIQKAIDQNDTILLTGGISMGDFDLVPGIIESLGFEIHFDHLAIKPGKPVVFASAGNKLCFGLSGNPVSSFFQFELLCKPAIYKQAGHEFVPQTIEFELAESISRKKPDRLGLYPVRYMNSQQVIPVVFNGSAHIQALTSAYGIVTIPEGERIIKKGTKVNVRPI